MFFGAKRLSGCFQVLVSFVDEIIPLDVESSLVLQDALRCLASKVQSIRFKIIFQLHFSDLTLAESFYNAPIHLYSTDSFI